MEEMNEYKLMRLRKTKLLNLGYKYNGKLLKNSLASYVYDNKKFSGFFYWIEKALCTMLYSIKTIKKNNNIMVDRDTDYIN